ncbi:MAG: hypothetical protein PHC70_03400 [Patescibacteria group bacterium]|nr:hypothetical protein [Patescibacteria group bacterium]
MEYKQDTIGDILTSEHEMVVHGAELYGEYFINANEFNSLLQDFIKSVGMELYVFAAFLSVVKKYHTLSLFSAVRRHHVQMMLDLRIVLEAGAAAAYAIANPQKENFLTVMDNGLVDSPKELSSKWYAWLDKNYSAGSQAIKNFKVEVINKTTAHANLIYAQKNFELNPNKNSFSIPFFDFPDDYHIKSDLWMIGNIALCLMDLFNGVNKSQNVIKFSEDFVPRLLALEKQNHRLKDEMMDTERFKKISSNQKYESS